MTNKAASEMGKRGGPATLKKHGKKHYQNMAKKSWENRRRKDSPKEVI